MALLGVVYVGGAAVKMSFILRCTLLHHCCYLLVRVVTTITVSRGEIGWISYTLVVGIWYSLAIIVGLLELLQWFSSSISNKQYTTQHVAATVVQQYYVICMVLRWLGIHNIQQQIYCRYIAVFLPDDLAYERGGR